MHVDKVLVASAHNAWIRNSVGEALPTQSDNSKEAEEAVAQQHVNKSPQGRISTAGGEDNGEHIQSS